MNLHAYRLKPAADSSPPASLNVPGAVPGSTPGALDPVPVFYPAGPMDWAFLYQQLQKVPFLGTAATWSAGQTWTLPYNSYALQFQSSSSAPLNKRVATSWADTWEVGTNAQLDGLDIDYYWKDLLHNALRMRLDTDGQLSLLGYAMANGIPLNGVVNVPLNLETRPFANAPAQTGLGVGIFFRLADDSVPTQVVNSGAINLVTDDVTHGATTTHFDFYCNQAGVNVHPVRMTGTTLFLLAGTPSASGFSQPLTLKNVTAPAAAGLGTGINWTGFDAASGFLQFAQQAVSVETATAGAVDTRMVWTCQKGGTEVEVMRIRGSAGMAAQAGTSLTGQVGGQLWLHGDLLTSGDVSHQKTDAVTNGILRLMTFEHVLSAGSVASGFGTEHFWQSKDAGGNSAPLARQVAAVTVATAGALESALAWSINRGGVEVEVFRARSAGMAATPGSGIVANVGGQFWVRGDFLHSGNSFGAYNVGPVTRPTVTGSRASNAALASLLTALASQGLIIDSSS